MANFKYIKPEEVEEYRRKGYEIEEGPHGGIRAYFPGRSRVEENDTYHINEGFEDILANYRNAAYECGCVSLWDDVNYWLKIKKRYDMGLSVAAAFVLRLEKRGIDASDLVNAIWGNRDMFESWVRANAVTVLDEEKARYIYNVFDRCIVEWDGEYILFRPLVRKFIVSDLKVEAFGNHLDAYIWLNNQDELHEARKVYRNALDRINGVISDDDIDDIFDEINSLINGLTSLAWDILNTPGIEVSDEKIAELEKKFADDIEENWNPHSYWKDEDIFSLEEIIEDDLDLISGLIGDYSARVVGIYSLFRKLGATKEEAISLAKGWEATRFWTGKRFKVYTANIEQLITKCNGNGRPIRAEVAARTLVEEMGKKFFEKYIDCNSFNSWRKFVQTYLRRLYDGDEIPVYRGVRYRELLQGLISYAKYGETRLGGVAESMTAEEEIASDWGTSSWYVKATINVKNVIGCWLNASAEHAYDEQEIMVEKPRDGLLVEFDNTNWIPLFEEWIHTGDLKAWCKENDYDYEMVRDIVDGALEDILPNGLISILNMYGEHKEFITGFLKDFIDVVEKMGWEEILEDAGIDLDDLRADYLEKGNVDLDDINNYLDFMKSLVELKKERRYIYIKPEEIEEYKSRGYEIKEGPKGGIRAYFPEHQSGERNEKEWKIPDTSLDKLTDFVRRMKFELSAGQRDMRYLLDTAVLQFEYGYYDLGLSFVALAILNNPQELGEYVKYLWGSVDNFNKWVEENKVVVNDIRMGRGIVGYRNVVEVDGEWFTFKPILEDNVRRSLNTKSLFDFVWFRDENILDAFKHRADIVKANADKGFVNGSSIVDGVIKKSLLMAAVVEDILNQGSIDVDDSKIEKSIDKFNQLVIDKYDYFGTSSEYIDDVEAIEDGYFSFENIAADWINEAEKYMDKYSARLFVFAMIFEKYLGFSKEEAFSLAKGWEIARFWTGENFKTYTHYIEKFIVDCKGNSRHVRKPYRQPNEYGFMFFNVYANCRDLENWRKFVQAYLKRKYNSDKITIYRGIKARETGQAIINFILSGGKDVRIGGVAESGTVKFEEAKEWGWRGWIFTSDIPIDLVIGCWLNASRRYSNDEYEVMFEKPSGGLAGKVINGFHDDLDDIFNWDNLFIQENAERAINIMKEGAESYARVYGYNSRVYKEYLEKMMKAKSILTGEVIKSLVKSFW